MYELELEIFFRLFNACLILYTNAMFNHMKYMNCGGMNKITPLLIRGFGFEP